MSKEIYQRLLQQFRDEWGKHAKAPFHIEIFAPGYWSTNEPPYDSDKYELIAQVALPYESGVIDPERTTLHGWAVASKLATTEGARKSFMELCREAGAALPPSFRDELGGLCHWYMTAPESWWLALLVYLVGESAYTADGQYKSHVVLTRPFLLSVDAIQRFGLNITDTPQFLIGDDTTLDAQTGLAIAAEQDKRDDGTGSPEGKGKLKPSVEKAYRQYLEAIRTNTGLAGAFDHVVYEWVKENLLDEGEQITTLSTWKRQLGSARRYYGTQKNTPKAERVHGSSIVRESEIEPPNRKPLH